MALDPVSIATIIGVFTLLIERFFSWAQSVKKCSCAKGSMEIDETETAPLNTNSNQPTSKTN